MKFLSIYKTKETGELPTQEEMATMGQADRGGDESRLPARRRGLHAQRPGARVRLSNGKLAVTDGPFTESKELVGGFAILQANSKQEAIELVKQFLLVAGDGECELRQVFEAEHSPETRSAAGS